MSDFLRIATQASSFAGFAAIAATVLHSVSTTGMPASLAGWAGFFVPIVAGIAAIIRDEASSIAVPPV